MPHILRCQGLTDCSANRRRTVSRETCSCPLRTTISSASNSKRTARSSRRRVRTRHRDQQRLLASGELASRPHPRRFAQGRLQTLLDEPASTKTTRGGCLGCWRSGWRSTAFGCTRTRRGWWSFADRRSRRGAARNESAASRCWGSPVRRCRTLLAGQRPFLDMRSASGTRATGVCPKPGRLSRLSRCSGTGNRSGACSPWAA